MYEHLFILLVDLLSLKKTHVCTMTRANLLYICVCVTRADLLYTPEKSFISTSEIHPLFLDISLATPPSMYPHLLSLISHAQM